MVEQRIEIQFLGPGDVKVSTEERPVASWSSECGGKARTAYTEGKKKI